MQRLNEMFGLEFATSFLISIQLDLMLAVMVNIRNFWYIPFMVWINSALSVLFLFFYVKFIYTLLNRSIKLENLRQSREEITNRQLESILEIHDLRRWVFLKKELKQRTSFLGGILLQLMVCKDLLVAFIIIGFIEYPLAQLIPSFLLFLASVVLIIKERPFKSGLFTTLVLTNELTYLLILGVYLVYYFIGGNISITSRYNYVGYGLICLMLLSVAFNCIVGLMEVIFWIVKKCSSEKSQATIQQEKDELFAFRKTTPDKPSFKLPLVSSEVLKIGTQEEDLGKGLKEKRKKRASSRVKNSVR